MISVKPLVRYTREPSKTENPSLPRLRQYIENVTPDAMNVAATDRFKKMSAFASFAKSAASKMNGSPA